jgi:hypothetical protein
MDEQTIRDYFKSERLTVFIFAYTILFGILLYLRLLGIKDVSLWILTGFFWFPFALYFSFLFFKVSILRVIGAIKK